MRHRPPIQPNSQDKGISKRIISSQKESRSKLDSLCNIIAAAFCLLGTNPIINKPALAQNDEMVAKTAQEITVRIEGATQGTGVIVSRNGDNYTVLTAWHVVSSQSLGEELDIFTPDNTRHPIIQGSIKRLGAADLATLSFQSKKTYQLARIGEKDTIPMGAPIYIAGFPLATPAVPIRLLRFLKGYVIANSQRLNANGYNILYSTELHPTLPGMSGGAALNRQGQLIGIHGQAETDSKMSEQAGIAIKTGTSQAMPVYLYTNYLTAQRVNPSRETAQQRAETITTRPPNQSIIAWLIDTGGMLELRTRHGVSLQAFFEAGRGQVGPRIWIEMPGIPRHVHRVIGTGRVREVRVRRLSENTTRFVVEFTSGTIIDPSKLRLYGISETHWRMILGHLAAPMEALGDGDLNAETPTPTMQ